MSGLRGRVALVTGAGRGLGRAYALRLASMGASVIVGDLNLRSYAEFEADQERMSAENTAAEIRAQGGSAVEAEFDVTDRDAVRRCVEEATSALGVPVSILVCNAGGGSGSVGETRASVLGEHDVSAVMDRNYVGTVNSVVACAPAMKDLGYGRIVTVSSQSGSRAGERGGYAHYGAAKAAIVMYTKYLAQDLGEYAITANCIAPGYIGTGRIQEFFAREGEQRLLERIALRRFGTEDDCAAVVGFLCSDEAAYVTGAVIPVDGGSTR